MTLRPLRPPLPVLIGTLALLLAGPARAEAISLAAALAAADDANIDLNSARNAVKTAAAGLRSADTAPNPQFSLNATQIQPGRLSTLGAGNVADTVARIDLPLERGGKRTARVAAARADLAAAGADRGDVTRQVHAAVADAWFNLMASERRATLYARIADSWQTGVGLARKQRDAGAISGGDLARQQVEALRAAAARSQALSDQREAQLQLAALIGQEAAAATLTTLGDWPAASPIASEDPDDVANRRPDVRAALARVESARRQLDGAHALKHPDITAGVQVQHAPGLLGVGDSVGLGLAFQLPVRNRYNGEVDAAGVALAEAEAQAAKARALAVADIITARRAAAEAGARRQSVDAELLPAARKAADTAEFAYKSGAIALLDLLDARRTLQSVELAAIDAHADEARAIARLTAAQATGDE
ncbi:MAG: hypothetical protein RL490_2030 [Pseudomonadota bacterium]